MTEHYSEKRRSFLKAVTILGGAALSLGAVKKSAARKAPPLRQTQRSSPQGYRETRHIRKYYETARS